jgi:hypothetical protein
MEKPARWFLGSKYWFDVGDAVPLSRSDSMSVEDKALLVIFADH